MCQNCSCEKCKNYEPKVEYEVGDIINTFSGKRIIIKCGSGFNVIDIYGTIIYSRSFNTIKELIDVYSTKTPIIKPKVIDNISYLLESIKLG